MALNNKKVNMKLQQTIEAILTDRPIAYHAVLAKAVGSATAGIFLSQLLYWTPRAHDKEGWIYKTQKDIYEETALTRWEQESARKVLRKAGSTPGRTGVLEEKRAGVPSRLYFRINMAAIVQLLGADLNKSSEDNEEPELVEPDHPTSGASHDVEKPHRTMWKNHILVSGNSTNKSVEIQQTFNETETTTESTTENDVVRQALQNFGVSKSAATKLTKAHPEAHILDKLELAQWLISTGSPLVAKSPAGWLRKAIEEDYAPPKNYQSSRQRQAKGEGEAKIAQTEARERRMAEEEYRRVKAETKAQLLEQYLPQPIG